MVGTPFHVRPSKLLSMSGVMGALLRQMSMARQSASFSSFERRLFAVEILMLSYICSMFDIPDRMAMVFSKSRLNWRDQELTESSGR